MTAVILPTARLTGQTVDGPAPLSMSAPSTLWRGDAQDLVRAVRVPAETGFRTTFIPSPRGVYPWQTSQWYLALTDGMTATGNQAALSLLGPAREEWGMPAAVGHARSLLRDPDVRLVVAPDVYAALRDAPSLDLSRVSTWDAN